MRTFKQYLEQVHIGKGFLSERVQKGIATYLRGDNVGGYLGHEGRFAQLDLIMENIFLDGKGHISPKELGEYLISIAGREMMDQLTDQLEVTARTFLTNKREEIIQAAKKAAQTEGDEDIK